MQQRHHHQILDQFQWLVALNSTHNGILIANAQGIVLLYNQAAHRIFRNQNPHPVGKHLSQVRPEAWPDIREILRTGQPQLGMRIELPQATIIANRNPIMDGDKIIGVISVFQDISDYEAIISQLRGYQELYREVEAVFESSFDGLFVVDGKGDTVRLNSAYERISGLRREDIVGRNVKELVRDKIIDRSVTMQVRKRRAPVTIMQKIQGDRNMMVTGTPVFDENDEISLVVINVRDLTVLNQLKASLEETRKLESLYHQSLTEQINLDHALERMVIRSEAMKNLLLKAVKAANVDNSVLLCGESGVGKSMLARIIHEMSRRRSKPFVKINCGAIPESLMESELFGYEAGSFTGALPQGKAGLFETADQGTIFLDEVAELTTSMQVKLLEVMDENRFTRIGATQPKTVNVRVIAATNQDLKAMMEQDRFREDLYYRLNVIPIVIPPLRERREDIPALARQMVQNYCEQHNLNKKLGPEVVDVLRKYDYPGNIRELKNMLESMMVMGEGETITLADVPSELRGGARLARDHLGKETSFKQAVREFELNLIQNAVGRYGSVADAAQALGVHPATFWRKLAEVKDPQ
ncbi:MAG: sigma 54-interacting transcriptional regulator [Proteobacteria bacterium]|nr:sigma 54-interacting transcriptional regulator [Pseudomonadota bacterium]MBU1449653.1 sigma 54-interacting transcriptional regulator [Pseudomonadota bacterium]MBU2469932.1 sigma 54-interacting transcriptional regulator [Pseudomonadota bacterium]MBU2516930.1 sigma 54-interacting transcriptional regulator [Pseudomonadota bacterium]